MTYTCDVSNQSTVRSVFSPSDLKHPTSTQYRFHETPIESMTAIKPNVPSCVATFVEEANRADLLAIARIRRFNSYTAGWDGPHSVGPNRSAIGEAESFARYLFRLEEITAPYISASGDGEINFYWKIGDSILDLGFTGDGTYSYYAKLPDNQEMLEDGAFVDSPLPREIIDMISGMA